MPFPREDKIYTYGDLLNFPEDQRWELIDGVPYMQARPTPEHQEIIAELITQFRTYLRGKTCRVFSELSVWLEGRPGDKNSKEYLIPDVVIVCNRSKVAKEGIVGVPDLIVEVLSPSTATYDKVKKLNRYESAGLKEYWVVSPEYRHIEIYTLDSNGRYGKPATYAEGLINVGIFSDFSIDLSTIFPKEETP